MWLFYSLLSTIIICGFIFSQKNSKTRERYIICIFTIFAILAMFRSENVGSDTQAYINLYRSIAKGACLTVNTARFEWGFLTLCKILNHISPAPQFLFIICGLFTYANFGYLIYRFSPIPWISTLLFFCLFFDNTFVVLRQTVATATICISFFCIIDRRPLKFLYLVLIASLFHVSAIPFLAAYPLSLINRYNRKWRICAFSMTIATVLLMSPLLNIAIIFFPRFQYYIGGTYMDGNIRAASILKFLVFTIIYLSSYYLDFTYRNKLELSPLTNRGYNAISNLTMVACLVVLVSFKATILSRFSDLLGFFVIIYYPNMLALIHKRSIRFEWNVIFLGMVVAYTCIVHLVRPEWSNTYPYTFFWQK